MARTNAKESPTPPSFSEAPGARQNGSNRWANNSGGKFNLWSQTCSTTCPRCKASLALAACPAPGRCADCSTLRTSRRNSTDTACTTMGGAPLGCMQLYLRARTLFRHQPGEIYGLHRSEIRLTGIQTAGQQQFFDQAIELGNVTYQLLLQCLGSRVAGTAPYQLQPHGGCGPRASEARGKRWPAALFARRARCFATEPGSRCGLPD